MKFTIHHQDSYSRGELLLRTFLGLFYIVLPHIFLLLFLSIWSSILTFIAFWSILFTGRYPESFFEFQVKLNKWQVRLQARMLNVADGYPAFGLDAEDEYTSFEMEYPESLSRGKALLKLLFGWLYVLLPHGFLLLFRGIATQFMVFIAWWAVLFTGSFPESWHTFITGYIRWNLRVNLYMGLMTDEYPPFTGKEV